VTDTNFLQIDPALAMGWITPDCLRIGFDHRKVVLENTTGAKQAVLNALFSGASTPTLKRVARRMRLSSDQLDQLLRDVAPVLISPSTSPAQQTEPAASQAITQHGFAHVFFDMGLRQNSPLEQALLSGLRHFGFSPIAQNTAPLPASCTIIAFARFLLSPACTRDWLRDRASVIPVTFSDCGVRIGPVLSQRTHCCPQCLADSESARDADWPVLAVQLMGRKSACETVAVGRAIAPAIALLRTSAVPQQLFLPVHAGEVVAPAELRPIARCAECESMAVLGTKHQIEPQFARADAAVA
jgi:hypothetical protein